MTPGEEKLAAALSAEYAAVYAYGVIGPHLAAGNAPIAVLADQVHRQRRDALITRLAKGGIAAPAADAAYALPFKVADETTALKLAVYVEDRSAAVWRDALGDTTGDDRKLALDALTDCATRSAAVRRLTNAPPLNTAFPGALP